MRHVFLTLVLLVGTLAPTLAQRNRPNFSIQLGYGSRFLNPSPLNLAIDSIYNVRNSGLTQGLSEVKWAPGFFAGAAIHRGRASIRLSVSTFGSSSFALGLDSTGLDYRRDMRFSGESYSLSLTSELIPIGDYVVFCVGAGFNATRLRMATAEVAASTFDPDLALPVVSQEWKPGFLIQTPFRFRLPPIAEISLEPYYQVFFAPGDFTPFSRELNGATSFDGRLKGDIDHFGVNLSAAIFLRPR